MGICQTQCLCTHSVMSNKVLQCYKTIARVFSHFGSSNCLLTRSVVGVNMCTSGRVLKKLAVSEEDEEDVAPPWVS